MAHFGEELRRRRIARGMTMDTLGAHVGVTQAYLSRVERDRVRPSAALTDRLAQVLDADPDVFHALAGIVPPAPPPPLGAILISVRQQRGWQQADLADRLGIDRSYLSQIERGSVTPSDRLLSGMAAHLAVPLDDLRRAAGRVDTAALLARAAEVDGLRDLLAAMPRMPVPALERLVAYWRDLDTADGQG